MKDVSLLFSVTRFHAWKTSRNVYDANLCLYLLSTCL